MLSVCKDFETGFENACNEEIVLLRAIFTEIDENLGKREEARSQMDYYIYKLGLIQASQAKKQSQGSLTEKDKGRLMRNQVKADSVKNDYTRFNKEVIAKMRDLISQKGSRLSRLLGSFVVQERQVLNVFACCSICTI